jgi:uncharacterized membrane protein YhaH (DUF805 family)
MKILCDFASGLRKMFAADGWLAAGILAVVLLTGLLTESGAVRPLVGGGLLFIGCLVVLVASVALHVRRQRDRLPLNP